MFMLILILIKLSLMYSISCKLLASTMKTVCALYMVTLHFKLWRKILYTKQNNKIRLCGQIFPCRQNLQMQSSAKIHTTRGKPYIWTVKSQKNIKSIRNVISSDCYKNYDKRQSNQIGFFPPLRGCHY